MSTDSMTQFFKRKLNFGRSPDWEIGEVFAHNRQYFDQILYKNQKFRHEYAMVYAEWLKEHKLDEQTMPQAELLLARINAAVACMGEPEIEKLFKKVLEASGENFPENLVWRDTLPGSPFAEDPANAALMATVARFWQRLALPEVREE